MSSPRGPGRIAIPGRPLALTVAVCALGAWCLASPGPATCRGRSALDPVEILSAARPDYRRFITSLRPLPERLGNDSRGSGLYMALVRPGASDPGRTDSSPLAGPGARNDVLYDAASIAAGHSPAWLRLLLDHEYFHARHLAGATALPLPPDLPAEVERHYFEAAAWGFNVAEARARHYPGLREDEFREALDRYGEHYTGLRRLSRLGSSVPWAELAERLKRPETFLRTSY
ncbi:MAG: hypothetical protein ACE5JH_00870 [Acidobacteriota bacterium]